MADVRLPSYVQKHKLAGKVTGYFWVRPQWAKPPALRHALIAADEKAHADARGVSVPDQRVPLAECPPGLFWYGDTLAMKTEYATTLENPPLPGDRPPAPPRAARSGYRPLPAYERG